MQDLLESLNTVQREAVQHTEGPLLILSGAGSGKTRVITRRIAYLIYHHKVSPSSILAVTFTRKAAGEMKTRLKELIGEAATDVWVSTFHSCCARILGKEITYLGYDPNFKIYDKAEQRTLVKEIAQMLGFKQLEDPDPIVSEISKAKNNLISPKAYAVEVEAEDTKSMLTQHVAQIYPAYEKRLRVDNALDFNDLIRLTIKLFENYPHVLKKYQDQFQYILVDEYQDTNRGQYLLVQALTQTHQNLCVVGDDDQSIYTFRGADIKNILDFEGDYPNAKVIHLGQNYRSTQTIVEAASHVIKNNENRKEKKIFTENKQGNKIICYQAWDPINEADYVLQQIQTWCKHGRANQDIAILYRTNAQSRLFEDRLRNAEIPYRIIGGERFYEQQEIKDILAYMRVIVNPSDTVSLKRIINLPHHGIGITAVEQIETFAREVGISLFEGLQRVSQVPGPHDSAKASVETFVELMKSFQSIDPPVATVEDLLDRSGYMEAAKQGPRIKAQTREENLKELGRVDICGIMVICQPSPYLIRNGQT